MKLRFSSLNTVKKESKFIRKIIKKHCIQPPTVNAVHNLVARMYGWQHYNEMAYHHSDRQTTYTVVNNPKEIGITQPSKTDTKPIVELSEMERDQLFYRKREQLISFLVAHGVNKEKLTNVIEEALTNHSLYKKVSQLFSGTLTIDVKNIPRETWLTHSICLGDDLNSMGKFYSKATAINADQCGGIYIVRESVSKPIINGIKSVIEEKDRLRVLSNINDIKDYVSANLFKLRIKEFFSILKTLSLNEKNSNPNNSWLQRSRSIINPLEEMLVHKFGDHPGALLNIDLIKEISIDNLINFAQDPQHSETTNKATKKYLSHIPGINQKAIKQDERVYEIYAFEIEPLGELLHDLCYSKELHTSPYKTGSKDILIIQIPNDEPFVQDFRPYLQSIIEIEKLSFSRKINTQETIDKPIEKNASFFRPLVLDAYHRYQIKGMAIVAAQNRSFGTGTFFNFEREAMNQDELFSIIANTRNLFIFNETDVVEDEDFLKVILWNYSSGDLDPDSNRWTRKGICFYTLRFFQKEAQWHSVN